jgi:hypothetical protein
MRSKIFPVQQETLMKLLIGAKSENEKASRGDSQKDSR